MTPRWLASDLDGTLIPPALDARRRDDIARFSAETRRHALSLAYITGRHLSLAIDGIREAGLPQPDQLFCDVGTSLFAPASDGYTQDDRFRSDTRAALGEASPEAVRLLAGAVPGLVLQEPAKQAEFKVSFYVRGRPVNATVADISAALGDAAARLTIVSSRDPVTGDGLVDILPRASGKRQALRWLVRTLGLPPDDILFAGDSGNDRDALLSGHPAVLVGNAPDDLRADLERAARRAGLKGRLYCARSAYAAGVVEGCRHFGFL